MGRSGLAGPAAGAGALATTVALAFDAGGFHAVTWDRALVLLAVAAFGLLVLAGVGPPGRYATVLLAALALLTAWTAASWLWSDSPSAALVEAQLAGAYLAAVLAVVVAGRRAPLPWLAGGVAVGIVPAACWNLGLRLAPDWAGRPRVRADIGSLADPVGYGNALALLAVVAILLLLAAAAAGSLPALPRVLAAGLLVPLVADLALQQSDGADAALVAGLAAFLLAGGRIRAAAALLALPAVALVAVAREHAVVSPRPWDVTAAAGPGHRLLLGLALLAAAQLALAWLALPSRRLPRPAPPVSSRAAAAIVVALAAAALAAAPFLLGGHHRLDYWRVAVHEFAANPLLGSGAGTYADWWVRTRHVTASTREAHSLYLETLAELGPIGLLALAAALGSALVAALRLPRSPWKPAALAVLVAYDVHAGIDFDWQLAAVTLPVFLLAASAAVHASPPRRELAPGRRAAAAAAAAALAAAGLLALAGSARLASAQAAEADGRYAAAADRALRALRFAPWSAEAWGVIGDARRALGDRAGARAAYRAALARDPSDWQLWASLAAVSTGQPRRSALAEAARLNPLGSGP